MAEKKNAAQAQNCSTSTSNKPISQHIIEKATATTCREMISSMKFNVYFKAKKD